jgi:hypothetical protein
MSTPYTIENGKLRVNKAFYEENKERLDKEAKEKGFISGIEYLASQAGAKRGGIPAGSFAEINPALKWSDSQLSKAAAVAQNHGLSLNEFLSIVSHESAGTMNPKITNSIGATGIIQFIPSTAADLLLKEQRTAAINSATTPEAKEKAKKDNLLYWQLNDNQKKKANEWAQKSVANFSVDRQLELTDLYLSERTKGAKGLEAVYTSIFAGNPNQEEFKKGTPQYKANQSLDKNKDGVLSRDEWMAHVKNKGPQIEAYLEGKDIKPDMSVARRTKAVIDASIAAQQTPAKLPNQTKSRPETADDMFGIQSNAGNTNLKHLEEILAQQPQLPDQPAQLKMPQLQQSKPAEEFRPNVIDAYGSKQEDELDLVGAYG